MNVQPNRECFGDKSILDKDGRLADSACDEEVVRGAQESAGGNQHLPRGLTMRVKPYCESYEGFGSCTKTRNAANEDKNRNKYVKDARLLVIKLSAMAVWHASQAYRPRSKVPVDGLACPKEVHQIEIIQDLQSELCVIPLLKRWQMDSGEGAMSSGNGRGELLRQRWACAVSVRSWRLFQLDQFCMRP